MILDDFDFTIIEGGGNAVKLSGLVPSPLREKVRMRGI